MDDKIETPDAVATPTTPAPQKAVRKTLRKKGGSPPRKAKSAPKPPAGNDANSSALESPQHHLAQMRHDPAAIRRVFETGEYPYASRMHTGPYEEHMLKLQQELLKAQRWIEATSERVVMLFEGRDAAGKGGTIKRYMEHMNPRTARVVALQKPTEREGTQWYFQRYISQLPAGGEICLFDRSWYNRAGVERVMGFCSPTDYLEFMRQCPEVERMLVRSGVRLFKYWFSVSREEQRRRFEARKDDPLKQWKLSPIDLASLEKWGAYTDAKNAMFQATDIDEAPWTVIKSDCKKRARLSAMRYLLHRLPYNNKSMQRIGALDPLIVGRAHLVFETGETHGESLMN